MALELSILTLNVWGIPYISKDRDVRINAIGDQLATGKYDMVSLQEVWSENDYQTLKKQTELVLPFAHYFYSGVVGSGLCVLSKWPILSAFYHQWSVNGYVHRIQHGDWFGGKGVGMCKINVNGKLIHFYTAHLHAEYDRKFDDYMAHRVIQAFDTAQFIENTRGSSILQILAGDLNTEPGDLAYRVLLTTSQLNDAYKEQNDLDGTNECAKNYYTALNVAKTSPKGKRIDYILHRPGYKYESEILEYSHPFPSKIPGYEFGYSDHEAVFAKIKIFKLNQTQLNNKLRREHNLLSIMSSPKRDTKINLSKTDSSEKTDFLTNFNEVSDEDEHNYNKLQQNMITLKESIKICDDSMQQLESHKKIYWTMAIGVASILFFVIDISPPYGLKTLYLVLKIILSGLTLFFIFMGTIWNTIEKHGILSGRISMDITLKSIEQIILNNPPDLN